MTKWQKLNYYKHDKVSIKAPEDACTEAESGPQIERSSGVWGRILRSDRQEGRLVPIGFSLNDRKNGSQQRIQDIKYNKIYKYKGKSNKLQNYHISVSLIMILHKHTCFASAFKVFCPDTGGAECEAAENTKQVKTRSNFEEIIIHNTS